MKKNKKYLSWLIMIVTVITMFPVLQVAVRADNSITADKEHYEFDEDSDYKISSSAIKSDADILFGELNLEGAIEANGTIN